MDRFQEHSRYRKSLRLKEHDYSQVGAYFITVCVHNRECLFGEIVGEDMRLNEAGQMVAAAWDGLSERFPEADLDSSVVMPNHTHGIVVIGRPGPPESNPVFASRNTDDVVANLVFAQHVSHRQTDCGQRQALPLRGTLPGTIGRIVQAIKSITTNEYIVGVKELGWPRFAGKLWQPNYYEHVIRSEKVLNSVREYVIYNPLRWALDPENPKTSK